MKYINLTKGKRAKVDDENFEWLNHWPWYFDNAGYARRNVRLKDLNGRRTTKTILMHRLVLGTPEGKETDHIDRDKLNNQINNLRVASSSENMFNKGADRDSRSGIKGVGWRAANQAWESRIKTHGKRIYLGLFKDINKAAAAYNTAAIKYHGDFAVLNKTEKIKKVNYVTKIGEGRLLYKKTFSFNSTGKSKIKKTGSTPIKKGKV